MFNGDDDAFPVAEAVSGWVFDGTAGAGANALETEFLEVDFLACHSCSRKVDEGFGCVRNKDVACQTLSWLMCHGSPRYELEHTGVRSELVEGETGDELGEFNEVHWVFRASPSAATMLCSRPVCILWPCKQHGQSYC